jgi:hypothetical protein
MTQRFVRAGVAAVLICAIAGAAAAAPKPYLKTTEHRTFATPIHPWWTHAVVELVTNGSFETGDFTGWNVVDTGGFGQWFVTDQTVAPLSAFPIAPAADGSFQALVDQTGFGSHILYQDVVIPPSISVTLNLMLWFENYNQAFFDPPSLDENVFPNQQMRIDIMNTGAPVNDMGAGILLNVFRTAPGDPFSRLPTPITADLTAFAGQTVRLRIAEVDNQFYFNVGVDAVSISAETPTDTKRAAWGDVKTRYR